VIASDVYNELSGWRSPDRWRRSSATGGRAAGSRAAAPRQKPPATVAVR